MGSAAPPRILVLEDEVLLAIDVQMMLEDEGFSVIGPAASVEEGLAILRSGPIDAAVLDINLHRERSDAVADGLEDLGVPFLYLTGLRSEMIPERHRRKFVVEKPVRQELLLRGLRELLG